MKSSSSPDLISFVYESFKKLGDTLKKYWAFLVLDLFFLSFVKVNGGIVVGDRSAHEAALHLMQLFYLFVVIAAYFPFNFSSLNKMNFLILGGLFALASASWQLRVEHLYLISDNRHLTFYIWRCINQFPPFFIGLSAVCAYLVLVPFTLETQLWLLCSAAVLIPAPLIEPRYFILPVAAWCLREQPQVSWERRRVVMALNIATTVMLGGFYKGVRFMW